MFIIVSRAGSSASKVIWLRACLSRFHSTSTVVKKNKVFPSSAEAVKDIPNGATILIGGFGPCGLPDNLLTAVKNAGPKKLHVIGNNAGAAQFFSKRRFPQYFRNIDEHEVPKFLLYTKFLLIYPAIPTLMMS